MHQKVLILDFGSQYTQLIARRVRELQVYCEIHPYNHIPDIGEDVQGIILSGSPYSVNEDQAPEVDLDALRSRFPLLGICYGAQLLAKKYGGRVGSSSHREYGRATISQTGISNKLFDSLDAQSQVWMSHGDSILELPEHCEVIASTDHIPVAAFHFKGSQTYGIQFHPEVTHSTQGKDLLKNFLFDICGCSGDWTPAHFISETTALLSHQIGSDHVILGLSGGVDSSVAAMLLNKAIGKQLTCIFINNGLLRKHEFTEVQESYKSLGLHVVAVDASHRFYSELKGVRDPEQKRKIIGRVFIEVFDEEAAKIPNVRWLAQGTIYPDVIESVSVKGPSATIKSHHNVGGLPERMNLRISEPLKSLFKDEVRRVGREMGLADHFVDRHPFPGPGLAIRIIDDVTEEKVQILQDADEIYLNILKEKGLYQQIWQAGAIFLPIRSVGVMGDERTYENAIALRAVTSLDGMTADWFPMPYDVLAEISNTIINRVKGINRVVYDISSKPPATIEWE